MVVAMVVVVVCVPACVNVHYDCVCVHVLVGY